MKIHPKLFLKHSETILTETDKSILFIQGASQLISKALPRYKIGETKYFHHY